MANHTNAVKRVAKTEPPVNLPLNVFNYLSSNYQGFEEDFEEMVW